MGIVNGELIIGDTSWAGCKCNQLERHHLERLGQLSGYNSICNHVNFCV
jgi:hypothetical protein